MKFHILTLFPEMVLQGLMSSITGRAVREQKIEVEAIDIRDYTKEKHRKVDDYPYGGGAGMLIQAQPVYDAYQSVSEKLSPSHTRRVIYVTPQGSPFSQQMAEEFSAYDDLIFLCGHYEGIDERVLEEVVTDHVSIGDYVMTGGELAAMVMVDVIARLVPGVLHNQESARTESFQGPLLEYPQYSRPEIWHGKAVPEVLLSGDAGRVRAWRLEESVKRTRERRPDLYAQYQELVECRERMKKQKRLHADMLGLLERGCGQRPCRCGERILLYGRDGKTMFYTSMGAEREPEFWETLPEETLAGVRRVLLHQQASVEPFQKRTGMRLTGRYRNWIYTKKEKLPVRGLYRQDAETEDGFLIRELANGQYGAYVQETLAGRAGIDEEGGLWTECFWTDLPEGEKVPVEKALWTFLSNLALEQGFTPYARLSAENAVSQNRLEELGFYGSKTELYCMEF